MAAQDIGGRDQSLFDAVVVDEHHHAEHVVAVLGAALANRPGAQAITDQGSPFMAQRAREALDELEVEHAPQREADPLGKATVERAFASLKSIAAPLLSLTDRLAERVPALADAALAKAMVTVVVTALLRAYQYGARAARAAVEARGAIDSDELSRRAELSRERARATERSARLLLTHLHEVYHLAGKALDFVRTFRLYPLVVLRDAERHLRDRLLRDDLQPVRDPWRYFGALVRSLDHEHRRLLRRRRREAEERRRLARIEAERARRTERFHANPTAWLRHALDFIAGGWHPSTRTLLFVETAIELAQLRPALRRLHALHGPAAASLARGVLHNLCLERHDRLGDQGARCLADLLHAELAKLESNQPWASQPPFAILTNTGKTPRPPPSDHLPN